jgi:hypothetical protein
MWRTHQPPPCTPSTAHLDRSPEAARQLTSRARRRVRGATPARHADLARQRRVVDAFLAALRDGNFVALLAVLDPDVNLYGDPRWPAVAAHAATLLGRAFAQPALIGYSVGLALLHHVRLVGALDFAITGDKITRIDVVADPGRLRQVNLSALSADVPSAAPNQTGAGAEPGPNDA